MRIRRPLKSQRILQRDMLGGVAQMFLSADHVRHAHQRIIDDDSEVIGRKAITLEDDEVFELFCFDHDITKHLIVDDDIIT